MSAERDEHLEKLHERAFLQGQQAEADEAAARNAAKRAKALAEFGKVAAETIDQVNQFAADGDPAKKEIAERIAAAIHGGVHQVAAQVSGDGRSAPEAVPFSKSLPPSGPASLDSTKALPNPSNEPPKRGRGRPKKNV